MCALPTFLVFLSRVNQAMRDFRRISVHHDLLAQWGAADALGKGSLDQQKKIHA